MTAGRDGGHRLARPADETTVADTREVLEGVTLASLARARLPRRIATLAHRPESWLTR